MNRIKELLIEQGMNQRDLAKKTGLNEVTISRYVHNVRTPRFGNAVAMAKVLGVKYDYLLGYSDER